jgi:hypothetical protein
MIRVSKTLFILACAGVLVGCSTAPTYDQQQFMMGSAQSKNISVDSSQFANRTVKLRLRSSSGDPDIDLTKLRGVITRGLESAGYRVSDENFGILVDVNAYMLNSVRTARNSGSNEIGALLGAVVGFEAGKRSSRISEGSGLIFGAIAGATLQEVLRKNTETGTYIMACDVNIGVARVSNTKTDSFVIGGNRIENRPTLRDETFTQFAINDSIKVVVYAGDIEGNRRSTIFRIEERLGRIVANLL